jgi:hypothetical protein
MAPKSKQTKAERFDNLVEALKAKCSEAEALKLFTLLTRADLLDVLKIQYKYIGDDGSGSMSTATVDNKDDNSTPGLEETQEQIRAREEEEEEVETEAANALEAANDLEAANAIKAEEQVEARKKAEKKVEEAAKQKKKIKCRYFLKFGSLDKNENGCKNGSKCPYFHPRLCRPALKGRCGDKGCGSHHLTAIKPPAREVKKTTTNYHSSSGNNNINNKSRPNLRPNPNQGHHKASWGPFLGKASLNPPGISSMEELAKIVTQMVIQSLGSMNSNKNNMQQSQQQTWGPRCQH